MFMCVYLCACPVAYHVVGCRVLVFIIIPIELSLTSRHTRTLASTLHGGSGGMASLRLQPPASFDFKEPDAWQKWKRRFEQFRQASGLGAEGDEKQVSTLLYCMGEDAARIDRHINRGP